MAIKRRDFLKLAGLTLLGTAIEEGFREVTGKNKLSASTGERYLAPPKRLKAKQWAMVIDIEKCKKYKDECDFACVKACNYAHNIPDIPPPKEIKWIWPDTFEHAFPEYAENEYFIEKFEDAPVLLLCNHCEHPPCVRVCPTEATFKRDDGIVMMDFHRCIGCRFCMAACPYGARSFNWFKSKEYLKHYNPEFPARGKGCVEKCLFCYEEIDQGKMPVCVEACPYGALIFGDLYDENSPVVKVLKKRKAIRRKEELTTGPSVFYLID